MKNKKIIIIAIITTLVIIVSIIVKDYIKYKSSKIDSPTKPTEIIDKDLVILKDEKYPGPNFTYMNIYINDKNELCFNEDCKKEYKPYLRVMSTIPSPWRLTSSDIKTGILFKDDKIRLVDIKNRIMDTLDLGENTYYELTINKEEIIGVIYKDESAAGFYNYKTKSKLYDKTFENLRFVNEQLIGAKNNIIYILDKDTEKTITEINDSFTLDEILNTFTTSETIHIEVVKGYEYLYYIFNIKENKLTKAPYSFEEMIKDDDYIYGLKNNTIYVIDTYGSTIATNKINPYENFRTINNYMITKEETSIKIINMYTGEEKELMPSSNLWLSEETLKLEDNIVYMILQEIGFDENPKRYEITYNTITKELKTKEL